MFSNCDLRNEELNNRISSRNIPSNILEAKFSIRPVSTKYSLFPIIDQYKNTNVPINNTAPYNIGTTFSPGNDEGPWSGYNNNIDIETLLRNQNFAIQKCEQSYYVPSSKSDLYNSDNYQKDQKENQPFPGLFESQTFYNFNPNQFNLGNEIFNNSTRQQLKNL